MWSIDLRDQMSLKKTAKALVPKSLRAPVKRAMAGTKRTAARMMHRLRRPNLYRLSSSERVGVVYAAPSEMSVPERLFLYSLVRGILPERILEIGSRHGGSASIMAAALEDAPAYIRSSGVIVGVDPAPEIRVPRRAFFGRFRLIEKPSPEALDEAREVAGGPFDFALVDGIHIYDQVRKDLAGLLPHMSDGAFILFHDAFHFGLSEALREYLEFEPGLQDCGYVCARPAVLRGGPVAYGGFRMLRVSRERVVDPQPIIERVCKSKGQTVPAQDRTLINHDAWYCRTFTPCEYCRGQANPGDPPQASPPAQGAVHDPPRGG